MRDTRRLRVLALSPLPEEGAGCRFRVAQYLPYLRGAGLDVTISPFYTPEFFRIVYKPGGYARKALMFASRSARRAMELADVGGYDLVWLYREAIPIGPPVIEWAISSRGIPIVYDFDDAIFLPNVSEANRPIAFLKYAARIPQILRRCTRVVVGNDYLAEFASRHHAHVSVIPTAVDTERFVPRAGAQAAAGRPPVVGWIGSPTTFRYLESIKDLLADVARRHEFVLRVSGAGRPVSFAGVRVEEVPWALADEVRLFNTLDIGIYPLADDEWSRGKCGFKAIQCMACGVPVVAAAIGVNRDIVADGVNSFLASTPGEWAEKLGRLIADQALRDRLGAAGRRTIEERYSLAATAPRLEAVLRSAVEDQA